MTTCTASELLPWYATGALSPEDRAEVEAHLARCPACRAELAFEQRLVEALAEDEAEIETDVAWQRLAPRLRPQPRRWTWAAVAAALLIGATVTLRSPAPYVTLTDPAGATLTVAISPTLAADALQDRLRAAGLEIVGGPSDTGLYQLALPEGADRAAVVAALGADGAILVLDPVSQ